MSAASELPPSVQKLLTRGVVIPCPWSVEVDATIDPERIAPGVIIHTGCRIAGCTTSIGPGSELGKEGPVVIEDCQLGRGVELKGGYFSEATFLDGVSMGSGAHVRQGTLLEEESGGAHAVGFKQTIFLPFVTAGSLINFCDALMAGGTSRKNHSEIGSSYIHFNFTPNQDKATASLIGDVPRGVMLDQPPIFLGGQGGMVGPVRISYGTLIAAGGICRQDVLDGNRLLSPSTLVLNESYVQGRYRDIRRIVVNNLVYIGNLHALKAWYQSARRRFMSLDQFAEACWRGAIGRIDSGVGERIKRLEELAEKLPRSLENETLRPEHRRQQQTFVNRWPVMKGTLASGPTEEIGAAYRDAFLSEWNRIDEGAPYLTAVASLSPSARNAGSSWLQALVDSYASLWEN